MTDFANRKTEKLQRYSPKLRELIDKLIQPVPADRPTTDEILNMELVQPYYKKHAENIVKSVHGFYDKLTDPDLQYIKGKAFLILERSDDAIKCFNCALNLEKQDPELHYMLGIAYFNSECYSLAIGCFGDALKIMEKQQHGEKILNEQIKFMYKAAQLNSNYDINASYLTRFKLPYVVNPFKQKEEFEAIKATAGIASSSTKKESLDAKIELILLNV